MQPTLKFNGGAIFLDGPKAAVVADSIRERMAKRIHIDVHEVERTDSLLTGVAIQLLASGICDRAGVLLKDGIACEETHAVLQNTDYENLIRIYEWEPFEEFARERTGGDWDSYSVY